MNELKIKKQEIVKAIEESGYLIEQRVEAVLSSHGFYVDSNDVYKDEETGKTREIDLTAISASFIFGQHVIFPFIIAECENNKQPIVFFRSDNPTNFLHHQEFRLSGIPIHFFKNPEESVRLNDYLNFEKFHHYCNGVFSTQYCSFQFTEKRGIKKWIALHPEEQHNTFQSIIKCLNYKIDEHFSYFNLPVDGYKELTNIQMYYPLLIVQGNLYEAFIDNGDLKLESRKHIQYRKQIAKGVNPETYQIDVITEDYLDTYLKIIDSEVDTIVRKLKRKKDALEKTIDILLEKLRNVQDRNEVRKIIDFE